MGAPRDLRFVDGGRQLLFLRSKAGDDPVTCLWLLDCATGETRIIVDPAELGADDADVPAAERARRERAREQASGIVSYAVGGPRNQLVVFVLGGVAYQIDVGAGADSAPQPLPATGSVFDARPDPAGLGMVAYVDGSTLRMLSGLDGSDEGPSDRGLLAAASPTVSWGTAEFVAGEEMGRTRGYWWSPDSSALVVERVDVAPVNEWNLADPTHPERPITVMRYPAAGTPNASVGLFIVPTGAVDRDDVARGRVTIDIDWNTWEYLADVAWDADGLRLTLQTRDQRRMAVVDVDPLTGATSVRRDMVDDIWVEIVPGAHFVHDTKLVTVEERNGNRQMCLDGEPVSGADLWVRSVAGSLLGGVVFTASPEPSEVHVYRWTPAGVEQLTSEPGVHSAVVGGAGLAITSATLGSTVRSVEVRAGAAVWAIDDLSERPVVTPNVELHRVGERSLSTAVLFPSDMDGLGLQYPLPVLLDPYGGPHAQRVLCSAHAYTTSQWFADQGYVVVITDGRGTPGRGGDWERQVYGDLAAPVLADQVDALHAVAELYPGRLDLGRVGIRGWSFGGYLAALAVLRRPDVFHAAVAGAPVTDWALYDTHYTERYLGHPATDPQHYAQTSLLNDAANLERPLMLIHGLADDNVVSAHTLQLSRALLEAGRPHTVLPLSGVSHMTPQEVVAENLLQLQVEFLRSNLTQP